VHRNMIFAKYTSTSTSTSTESDYVS
jgi:hypothetical protein